MDIEYELQDEELPEDVLPDGVSFDVLYYYPMEGPNDHSPAKGGVPIEALTDFHVSHESKGHTILLHMPGKTHTLVFD